MASLILALLDAVLAAARLEPPGARPGDIDLLRDLRSSKLL